MRLKRVNVALIVVILLSTLSPLIGKGLPYIDVSLQETNSFDTTPVVSEFLLGSTGEVHIGGKINNIITLYGALEYSTKEEMWRDNIFRSRGDNLSLLLGCGVNLTYSRFLFSNTLYFGIVKDNMYSESTPTHSLALSLKVTPKITLYYVNPAMLYLTLPIAFSWILPNRVSTTLGVGIGIAIKSTEDNK